MDHGKICLILPLMSYEKKNTNYPQLFVDIVFNICFTVFASKLIYRAYRYITNVCPKRSMVCIGKYRRNICRLSDDILYFTLLTLFFYGESFVTYLSKTEYLSPTQTWSVRKFCYILVLDIFHGLVLPLIILVRWTPAKCHQNPKQFYVRKTEVLEPRRSCLGSSVDMFLSKDKGKGKSKTSEPKYIKHIILVKPYDNRQMLRIDQSLGIGHPQVEPFSLPDVEHCNVNIM